MVNGIRALFTGLRVAPELDGRACLNYEMLFLITLYQACPQ